MRRNQSALREFLNGDYSRLEPIEFCRKVSELAAADRDQSSRSEAHRVRSGKSGMQISATLVLMLIMSLSTGGLGILAGISYDSAKQNERAIRGWEKADGERERAEAAEAKAVELQDALFQAVELALDEGQEEIDEGRIAEGLRHLIGIEHLFHRAGLLDPSFAENYSEHRHEIVLHVIENIYTNVPSSDDKTAALSDITSGINQLEQLWQEPSTRSATDGNP